jgi:hypothetical protein
MMAQLRKKQKSFDLALPWAKKAVDVSPRDTSDAYNTALMEYSTCLVSTNGVVSALEIAQERVDFWIGSEKNAEENTMIMFSRQNVGWWLKCISRVHFRMGNKKLALRYGELGSKEFLTNFFEVQGDAGVAKDKKDLEWLKKEGVRSGDLRICSNCFKTGNHDVMPKCSQCHSEFYCNVDCQKKRWPGHKNLCKKVVAEKKNKGAK